MDPFKEDLTCDFAQYSMIQHLDAIHAHRAAASTPGGVGVGSSSTSGSTDKPLTVLKGIEVQ